jgi:leucyl aminopeptidase
MYFLLTMNYSIGIDIIYMTVNIKFCNQIDESIKELATAYEFEGKNDQFFFDQKTSTLYIGTRYEGHPIDCSDYDKTLYYPLGLKTLKQSPSKVTEFNIDSSSITQEQLNNYLLGLKTSFYKYTFRDGVKIKDIKIKTDKELDKNFDALIEGLKVTKTLLDQDSYTLNPTTYVEQLKVVFKDLPVWAKLKIIESDEINKLGMKMLAGVGRGSKHGTKIAIVEVNAIEANSPTSVFIGKGLTFDTGGTNIKENGGSFGMHDDMGGSGTIFGIAKTITSLRQPKNKNIIFLAGLVENVTDGNAFHPGEILENIAGQTAIIKNTDAEGRLTLADVVPYSIINYKPKEVFTLATLTGAAIASFTSTSSPIFSTSKDLRNKVYDYFLKNEEEAISVSLPSKAYSVGTKDSTGIADMSNTGTYPSFHGIKVAGSQTAAAFVMASGQPTLWKKNADGLEKKIDCVHIDIAGTAVDGQGFGTGYAVRSLVDYIINS